MTRHVIDHPGRTKGTRAKRFIQIERIRGIKPRSPVETLRRKPRQLSGALRLKRFLAIKRAEL